MWYCFHVPGTEGNSNVAEKFQFIVVSSTDNNITPTTKNDEKLALSFLFKCINPNFDPQEEILVSIESQEDEENDSIV